MCSAVCVQVTNAHSVFYENAVLQGYDLQSIMRDMPYSQPSFWPILPQKANKQSKLNHPALQQLGRSGRLVPRNKRVHGSETSSVS